MNFIVFLEQTLMIGLIAGIGGGILLLLILFLILNKFVFAKQRIKKTLKEISSKHEYLHSLLSGQIVQYISRLDTISNTNLLYAESHQNYFRKYKELRDNQEVKCDEIIGKLENLYSENKIKEFKTYYKNHENTLNDYEALVNELANNLSAMFSHEENSRNDLSNTKDKLRELKSRYNSREHELNYVLDSFSKCFAKIEGFLAEIDDNILEAKYNEADELINHVNKVIDVLFQTINDLPQIIEDINVNIPNKERDILNHYQRMIEEDYPLKHLEFDLEIPDIETNISKVRDNIIALNIENCRVEIDTIDKRLNYLEDNLGKEESAKKIFDEKFLNVSNDFLLIEKEVIKITNNMTKFTQVYVVDEEHQNNFANLKKLISTVGTTKRSLENLVHRPEKTPYSMLVEKVKLLEEGTNNLNEKLNEFLNYFKSLRTDSEIAYHNIEIKNDKIKEYEEETRNLLNDNLINSFKDDFNSCYELIDDIYELLKTSPINVKDINEKNSLLNEKSNNIVNSIEELKTFKKSCEENFLKINKERKKYTDIEALMAQAENQFLSGNFKSCYDMTASIITKIENKKAALNK